MSGQIRRVVVSGDADGKPVVLQDGAAPAVMTLPAVPGTALVDIWRSDVLPVPVPAADDPTAAPFALMPAGSLFRVIDLGPTGDADPMWHQTASVDFIYIASGTGTILYDGGSLEVGAGETIVVGGIRHAWVNRGDDVCRIVDFSATISPTTPS